MNLLHEWTRRLCKKEEVRTQAARYYTGTDHQLQYWTEANGKATINHRRIFHETVLGACLCLVAAAAAAAAAIKMTCAGACVLAQGWASDYQFNGPADSIVCAFSFLRFPPSIAPTKR